MAERVTKGAAALRTAKRVLAVDDDRQVLALYEKIVGELMGLDLVKADSPEAALELFSELQPEVVLLDAVLPQRHGLELLAEMRALSPRARLIMITGYATVEMAVEAMKAGAYDYLQKPFNVEALRQLIAQALAADGGRRSARRSTHDLIGISAAIRRVCDLIQRAAQAESTVLIEGPSGVGKEVAARAIHAKSARAEAPFVPVDCGAISPGVIESELFGHMAGAFTDARGAHDGLLRAAGKGAVFLDEIGELPAELQVKLLRALQNREVRPVGSSKTFPLEARVLAATNRDLAREVESGRFRRDLFYRLHVIPIFIPPLAERKEDVPELVQHFLGRFQQGFGRALRISPAAMRWMMSYNWPGNVRELENCIERAFALVEREREVIEEADMEMLLPACRAGKPAADAGGASGENRAAPLARQEEAAIRAALERNGGNKKAAAKQLGIGLATLYRRLRQMNSAERNSISSAN